MKRDLELLYEIGCFRFVPRMWVQFLGADFANNTEHAFRVVWIALVLAKREGLTDTEKIMKMALIHDLAESRMGDTHYMSRMYNTRKYENLAMDDILKSTSLEKDLLVVWKEYSKRKSPESLVVKDADTLDVDFELLEQASRGNNLGTVWQKQRKLVSKTIRTDSARKMWLDINKSNPHDWHLKARNRFYTKNLPA